MAPMPPRSLRLRMLRMLLPWLALILGLSALAAYYPSIEPATKAYDYALVDAGLALAQRIHVRGGALGVDLPSIAEQVLRTDKYDKVFFVVNAPDGTVLAGDRDLPSPPPGAQRQDNTVVYDGDYRDQAVRVAELQVPCDPGACTIRVAETTVKRQILTRDMLLWSVVPQLLFTLVTLAFVWYVVTRGLQPLARLSEEIKARSPKDLHPIGDGGAPEEVRPLVAALNQIFGQMTEANRNQQRFLANAAHQLRTPLAGLQAHTELALAQPVPEACRAELEQVHGATIRTARLATQLLALARAEPGGRLPSEPGSVALREVVEEAADEWVHSALARDIDLGFDLGEARVRGDEFLLREGLANLVANAIEYTPGGGHVTVRTGTRAQNGSGQPFLEVEDDGPGIPLAERERVLERFYRVPGTAGLGSGLGLAIVREIAAAHGAQIEIGEGEGGRGCRIRLNFPQTPPA